MKTIKLFLAMVIIILSGAIFVYAEMGNMGADMPADIAKMMQEQNKALAQASVKYLTLFTNCLYTQSNERRDQIDPDFIKSDFAEMKRAYDMIEKFQGAHVMTMDDDMQVKVKPMMERMNLNLASIKRNLDELEREVNGGSDLDKIALFTGEILKGLDEMQRRPGGMPGMSMSGQKPPMQN